jgi:HCOMODA/2-hydroxy-3-carboxy-muconic semialdehyde decarboxylase
MAIAAILLPATLALAAPSEGLPANLQYPQVRALVDELVIANHILYDQGVVDGFGHISARSPLDPTHFFMARSVAPSSVVAGDIMEFDADGNVVGADKRAPYAERFIHSEVYKARPDVLSVVHGHSASVIPYGVSHVPLRPVFHMSAFLGAGTPIFEIRDVSMVAPDTDMLVKTPRLGAGLAKALGKSSVVLMRGHGFTAVAYSVPVAVFRSVYTDQNARIESAALQLGRPQFLSEEESALAQATMEKLSVRSWDMWKTQAAAAK